MLAAFICTKNVQFMSVFALFAFSCSQEKVLNFPWHVDLVVGFPAGCRARNSFPPTVANMISSSATSGCLTCSRRSPPTLFQMSRLEGQPRISYFCLLTACTHQKSTHHHRPHTATRSLVLAGSAMSAWALIPGRPIAAAPSDARGTETSLRVCVYFC